MGDVYYGRKRRVFKTIAQQVTEITLREVMNILVPLE